MLTQSHINQFTFEPTPIKHYVPASNLSSYVTNAGFRFHFSDAQVTRFDSETLPYVCICVFTTMAMSPN